MTGGHSHSADFQRLIERRRKFIEGLDANRGEINLEIFEDFYPDRAHFVYELLQNAEDAGATEVADRYATGPLGGSELTGFRYLVIVSGPQVEIPANITEGSVRYRHVNIAVQPHASSQKS